MTNFYSQTCHPEIYRRVRKALGVAHKIVAAFGKSWKKKRDLHKEQMKQNKDRKCLFLTVLHDGAQHKGWSNACFKWKMK